LLGVLTLAACAHAPRPTRTPEAFELPTFAGLRGHALTVDLVDTGKVFASTPEVPVTAQRAAEQQLRQAGVTVADGAPRRLRLSLAATEPETQLSGPQSCLRVEGQLELTSALYLPGTPVSSTRCVSGDVGGGANDPLGALLMVAVTTVVQAARGELDQLRAQALSYALGDVLTQLDQKTHGGLPPP
jgi:hypothetical protein